jgi:TolB protein
VASEPPAYHVEPAWSPDGQWITYRFIEHDTVHDVYKVRPNGTSRTNLTNYPAMDIEPAWSPDGEWIVFASSRTGNFDLHMMKADGSEVTRLTNSDGKDSDPTWGP